MTIDEINTLTPDAATRLFADCNAARHWVERLTAARPFASVEKLKLAAEEIWLTLGDADYLQAFEAHPMIGDVDSLRKKYASTKAIASGEQSGATGADEAILTELSRLNKEYLKKFGFIFIVFATGKSAEQMLELLKARIDNSKEAEIQNAAAEQLKITLLRLDKIFA